METLELQYVPLLDSLRLIFRVDGCVESVIEAFDPDSIVEVLNRELNARPRLLDRGRKIVIPHHVCVRVWS